MSGTAEFPQESDGRGEFVRQKSAFRDWIGSQGSGEHPAEAGRYHLYVSLACPWANRTIIVRRLKRLEEAISLSVVDPIRDERGWAFTGRGGDFSDPVNGFFFLSEAYSATDRSFDGRVTVPVLWDKVRKRIVNNESSQIIRMLNSEFDAWGDAGIDLYPEPLRTEIDAINDDVYENVNNGVYRAGFASAQDAYDAAFERLFDALDRLDARLASSRYLVGDAMTEADWRLFTTLVRFDAVYVTHFKCNLRRIADFANLSAYLRDLYQTPGVAETVDFDHIKRHYFVTHAKINPLRIVPRGPELDLDAPHSRAAL